MDQATGRAIEEFVKRLGADAERALQAIMGTTANSPWASFQRPGDIVLTRGRRPISHLNAMVQSILEGGIARATHAMMVAAPGYYVDASIRFGVTVVPAHLFCIDGIVERLRAATTGDSPPPQRPMWRRQLVAAFRHPEFASQPERHEALTQAIAAQLGQPYNLRFIFKRVTTPDEDRTAFCSELVARTFAKLGLPIVPDRRFATILPHTLMRSLHNQGWVDVSDDYRAGLPRAFAA